MVTSVRNETKADSSPKKRVRNDKIIGLVKTPAREATITLTLVIPKRGFIARGICFW
jgi:hypothetical protein